jgi:uncharacterized protein (TIGR02265 family)
MDTRQTLQQRIQMARAEDQVLGLFYEYSLACMGELFGAEAMAQARAVAGAARWTGFFRYPVSGLLRMVDAGLEGGSEQDPLEYSRSLERLGQAMAQCFLESTLGRAYRLVAGKEPHTAMCSTMGSAKASCTYGQRGYERLGPTRARLVFQQEMLGSSWIQGFYHHGLQLITGLPLEVTLADEQGPGTDFCLIFSW